MSKFCGVISNNENHPDAVALLLRDLEELADSLLNETDQVSEEFETKCAFAQEQQRQVMENERNLTEIDGQLNRVAKYLSTVEMNVKQNDEDLQQVERNVSRLEVCATVRVPNTSPWCAAHCGQSEHEKMLNMFETTDNAVVYIKSLMEEFWEHKHHLQLQENPYDVIMQILDLHVRTLKMVDVNLDNLAAKIIQVDKSLMQTKNKLNLCYNPKDGPSSSHC